MIKLALASTLFAAAVLTAGPAKAGEPQEPAGPQSGMTVFSKNWLTMAYPKNFKFKSEFRGQGNYLTLEDPAGQGNLFMIYSPLSENIPYARLYEARCAPDTPRFKGSDTKVVRSGDHRLYPGAKETLAFYERPLGTVCYWCIMARVGDHYIEIDISELGKTETEALAAMERWAEVVDSIKIDPAKAVFSDWDGVERFDWSGPEAAPFVFTFHPENAFVNFHDAKAGPLFNFGNKDFDQGLAKAGKKAAIFTSDALDIVTGFHFNEKYPPPEDQAWERVLEGRLNVPSGRLCFESPPLEIALPKKGVYTFRIYLGRAGEIESQEMRVYLSPSDQKENNRITVLKD